MASKVKFISDLRKEVTDALDAWARVIALVRFFSAMGWTADEFASLVGDDMTVEDLTDVLTTCVDLDNFITEKGRILGNMKP